MRFLLVLVALTLVVGCGDEEGSAAQAPPLEGPPWEVVSGIDVSGWESVAPSALFADGTMSGFDGCNQYQASYEVDGDALDLQQGATTLMACGSPGQEVSAAYSAALERVTNWRIDGDELVLLDGKGGELLRYRVPSLVGSWEATSFLQANAVSSLIAGTTITATFDNDGTLSGSSGCNTYTAKYTAEQGSISITGISVTEMACEGPAGVMEQETAYLAALPKAKYYDIDGRGLALLTATRTFVATYAER